MVIYAPTPLGNGTDVIVTTTGANITGVNAGAATTAETLSFAGTTTLTAAQIDGFTTLTGTSTPLLTLTTAITAAMLDDAAVSNTLTTIKLADVASNAITAANATLASGIVLNIDGSALTGSNQLTFSRGTEADGKFGIIGGAGADVFNYSTTGQLISSAVVIDTINGGAGTSDELKLTAATGTTLTIATGDSLANITNVEKITAGSSAGVISITRPATTNTNFTTIDLSGDIDTTGTNVISNTGANAITTIIGSAGVDQVSVLTLAPATSVTGGSGIDTFTITAPAAAITITDLGNDADTFTTATSGTTNATLYASSNAVSYTPASGTVGASTTVVMTAPSGTTTATVNLNSVTNSGLLTLNVTAASGATLTLPTAAGAITVNGGAGVDTVVAAGTLLSTVSIDGAGGTDILKFVGAPNISAATIANVETLDFNNIVAGAGTPYPSGRTRSSIIPK